MYIVVNRRSIPYGTKVYINVHFIYMNMYEEDCCVSCRTARTLLYSLVQGMARRRTMTEEDEIQLVDQGNDEEEEAGEGGMGLRDGDDRDGDDRDSPPCLKINFSDLEGDSPRVEDERHIKHPGKLKMRLRVWLILRNHRSTH